MKMTEFYEKYWRIEGKEPPALSNREKAIWDIAEELECNPYVKVWRRKYGWVYIINPMVEEQLNQEKRFE